MSIRSRKHPLPRRVSGGERRLCRKLTNRLTLLPGGNVPHQKVPLAKPVRSELPTALEEPAAPTNHSNGQNQTSSALDVMSFLRNAMGRTSSMNSYPWPRRILRVSESRGRAEMCWQDQWVLAPSSAEGSQCIPKDPFRPMISPSLCG